MAQPAGAKLRDGVPRSLLRRGMRGILPDTVRLRSDKINFIDDAWRGLKRDPAGTIAGFATHPPERLAPYVNMDVLQQVARSVINPASTPESQVVFFLWRAIWLDLWLDARARRAVPPAEPVAPSPQSPAAQSAAPALAAGSSSSNGHLT